MKYTFLPNTEIKVSKICLGTMTFGEQNTEADAHEQLNYALENGVNFIDTAEMYSVPGRKETQGSTERFIGNWLKDQKREDIILATKIAGPSAGLSYVRDNMGFSNAAIDDAIEKSFKRLQTDYIDLYQLHWPERNANFFGKRNYVHNSQEKWEDNFKQVVEKLDMLVKEGKIRHYGVSNETPWGMMRHLEESKNNSLTRCKTVQNAYSLLNRTFEIGMAEIAMRENVGLLAYSPLAFGALSGKYLGNDHTNSRMEVFPQLRKMRKYLGDEAIFATKKYVELAKKNNITPTQLALAFVNQRPFVTSNIIGATNLVQLKENIGSIDITLSEEILIEIDVIQELQPNPAP